MSAPNGSPRKAGLLQLSFLIYGVTCAGAYGLESLVSDSGPGLALTVLLLLPVLWAVPISLACAELGAAFPIEGGYYRWSKIAFGEFWGFQAGWWSYVGNFVNNGAFAVLFADYLKAWGADYEWLDVLTRRVYPPLLDPVFGGLPGFNHWIVCVALIWVLTYLNVRGIRVVADSAIVFNVLLLLPFVFLTVIGALRWQHNPFIPFLAPGKEFGVAFSAGIMVAIWLYSGWDKMSTASEEVENPQRNFPLALALCVPMVIATYAVPTASTLGALGNWQDWSSLSFAGLAEMLGGAWLKHGMIIGALLSNAILLEVTMLTSSRLPFLVLGSAACSVLALMPFLNLIDIYAWLQMTSYVLIFATLVALRKSHATTPRPFVVPGRRIGLLLASVPPSLLALFVMYYKLSPPGTFLDRGQLYLGVGSILSGPAAYLVYLGFRRGTRSAG